MAQAGAGRLRAGREPGQPANDHRKCRARSWVRCCRAGTNTKGNRSCGPADGSFHCPSSAEKRVCIPGQASRANKAPGFCVTWWITQIGRAQAERVAIADLESRSVWLEIVNWHVESGLRLAVDVTITHAAEVFSLTYPAYFPEAPPSVKGARRAHFVLAAPNSVVFRLGRSYDKRNLPPVVVYQFENGSLPAVLGAWTCRWRVLVAQRLFAPREAGRARLVFGTRNGTIPAFATRNRSRSNSTDFPRLDLRGSRVVPRDSGTLKSQKPNKLSVYTVQKSCGQLLGENWPRVRAGC